MITLVMILASALIICLLWMGRQVLMDERPHPLIKLAYTIFTVVAIIIVIATIIVTQIAVQAISLGL